MQITLAIQQNQGLTDSENYFIMQVMKDINPLTPN